jgi:Rod binding domain-containing protein
VSAADLEISAALSAAKPTPLLKGSAKNAAEAEKAAQEFEAVFIGQMLSAMFESVRTDGPFGGGSGEMMFRSLMIDHYAKTIAGQGGIGLADQVKREILRLQEIRDENPREN